VLVSAGAVRTYKYLVYTCVRTLNTSKNEFSISSSNIDISVQYDPGLYDYTCKHVSIIQCHNMHVSLRVKVVARVYIIKL